MHSVPVTLAAGLLLVAVAGQALAGMSVVSPAPLWLVVLLWSGVPRWLVVAIPALLLWAWHPMLFKGSTAIPRRTFVLLAVIAVSSAAWYLAGWQHGAEYQGRAHTLACLAASMALLAASALALWLGRKQPSYPRTLAVHVLIFAWLSSYAFPYLGETP